MASNGTQVLDSGSQRRSRQRCRLIDGMRRSTSGPRSDHQAKSGHPDESGHNDYTAKQPTA